MCSATTTRQTLGYRGSLSTLPLLRQTNAPTVQFMPDPQDILGGTDDIDNYMPSQDFLSPFTSDGVVTLMREVSGNPRIGVIQDDDEEEILTQQIN
jgi:hypothetical protein